MEILTEEKIEVAGELTLLVQSSGIAEDKQISITNSLSSFFAKASEWNATIQSIIITSPDEVGKMRMAKEGRLTLKNMRLDAEKLVTSKRKEVQNIKADYDLEDKLWLKSGQMVEAIFKNLESKLEEKEKFAEVFEANRKATLRLERLEMLSPYGIFGENGYSLSDMDQVIFDSLLSGVKKAQEDRIEAEQKAEQERLAAIEAENKRQADIKAENERLKLEAEENQKALAIERAKVEEERKQAELNAKKQREEIEVKAMRDREMRERENKRIQTEQNAKLEAERIEKQKLADQIKAKEAAELQAINEAELEAKKASNAPEKAKLIALAKQILELQLPTMVTPEGIAVLGEIWAKNRAYSNWIITQANTL